MTRFECRYCRDEFTSRQARDTHKTACPKRPVNQLYEQGRRLCPHCGSPIDSFVNPRRHKLACQPTEIE